ncbi:MAG: hypothetical protein JWO31_4188 [Phycisphaerales bacterium]|nr:hypothetical protein [Phycisphaerales bacterium]
MSKKRKQSSPHPKSPRALHWSRTNHQSRAKLLRIQQGRELATMPDAQTHDPSARRTGA